MDEEPPCGNATANSIIINIIVIIIIIVIILIIIIIIIIIVIIIIIIILLLFQRSFQRYFSEKKLPFNIFDLYDSVRAPSALNIQNAVISVSSSYPSTSYTLEAIFAGSNISSVSDCTFQIMTGPVNIVNEAALI